jgi:hypothetical protein
MIGRNGSEQKGLTLSIWLSNRTKIINSRPTKRLAIHSSETSTRCRMMSTHRKEADQDALFMYGQPDGPATLVNPNERIPCSVGLGSKPNPPQFTAGRSEVSTPTKYYGSTSHTADRFDPSVAFFERGDVPFLVIDEMGDEEESEEIYEEED